jgi:glycosyltransferase involved in cell wall biosynthesis
MSETATISAHVAEIETLESRRGTATPAIRLCHFTTVHTSLKSRSFHRQCLPLAQAGIEVRYVAPIVCKQAPRKQDDAIEFISTPFHKKRLRRALANPALLRELLRQDASLYHFQDPELLPLALALKIIFRKRVVYDAYEDFPSMARNSKSMPRSLAALAGKVVEGLESVAARCLDGVITADPLTLRRFARTGKGRKLVFHNFPNLDFFPAPRPTAKPFDVVYRGGISDRAGTLVLLDALRILADRQRTARTLLLGYFDSALAETRIRERIRRMGLESIVEIHGRIDHEEMAAALSEARIGVCPLQPVPKFLLNIPVKVFEYWACGLPVVASDLPPIRPYFPSAHAGLLFEPGNANELARSIEWMLEHPVRAAQMGQNGRAAVIERFNNCGEVRKLQRFCAQLTADDAAPRESTYA